MVEEYDVLVVGGGPAGLRAAEIVSAAGRRTIVADRMPSVGRKFLVAGRGGLNLTHSEELEKFARRYGEAERWRGLLAVFSPDDLRAWAGHLGVETFVGTSGRIFPETKQAAPLLRRWVALLKRQEVEFRLRHKLVGLAHNVHWQASFSGPNGEETLHTRAVIMALGGGSWPQTGSDGAWTGLLSHHGVALSPLVPANSGYEVDWSADFLRHAEGHPLKNVVVSAGGISVAGELLITRYGLEGGALYQLGRPLRAMETPSLSVDLKPTFTAVELARRLTAHGNPTVDTAARAWKLGAAATELLRLNRSGVSGPDLAALAKQLPIRLGRPRPLAEAISTAGGVDWNELDEGLMLRHMPGVFCAGEMIDWEAPTGGYLLQGCFCTGMVAAQGALAFLSAK